MAAAQSHADRRMMSTLEVANLFGVDRRTVVRWCAEGRLGYIRPGRKYFIPAAAYENFVNRFSNMTADEKAALLSEQGTGSDDDEDEMTGE